MNTMITQLDTGQPAFPPVERALNIPQGLLAIGGNLNTDTLIEAYRRGIFPWFEEGQPIMWYSPDPRLVLKPEHFHESRSLKKTLRKEPWSIAINRNFDQVIEACAQSRRGGTWLCSDMIKAYRQLHRAAYAHSVEVYDAQGRLLGGLYGVGLGCMFFGESMFSRVDNASKVALSALCKLMHRHGLPLIDCQIYSDHLHGLGAQLIRRQDFIKQISKHCGRATPAALWQARRLEI